MPLVEEFDVFKICLGLLKLDEGEEWPDGTLFILGKLPGEARLAGLIFILEK